MEIELKCMWAEIDKQFPTSEGFNLSPGKKESKNLPIDS